MSESRRFAQIAMLRACARFTSSGVWVAPPTYPNCAWDMIEAGLIRPDKRITLSGRVALFMLGEGPDPMPVLVEAGGQKD